jgi:hypothetical protein
MHSETVEYLVTHSAFTTKLLSRFYPFTPEQRVKYRDVLDPLLLAKNTTQKHNVPDTLKPFIELFDLSDESPQQTESIPSEMEYDPILHQIIHFGQQEIEQDKQAFYHLVISVMAGDQPIYNKALCANTSIPWTESKIQLMTQFMVIDWPTLSMNTALPWSEKLIDQYLEKWWWGELATEPKSFIREYRKGLLNNPAIPWCIDWLIKYERFINLDLLAENENIWNSTFGPNLNIEGTESELLLNFFNHLIEK